MVVNAANEVAVEAFLEGTIGFNDIAGIVAFALRNHTVVSADSLEIIEETDHHIRTFILSHYLSSR